MGTPRKIVLLHATKDIDWAIDVSRALTALGCDVAAYCNGLTPNSKESLKLLLSSEAVVVLASQHLASSRAVMLEIERLEARTVRAPIYGLVRNEEWLTVLPFSTRLWFDERDSGARNRFLDLFRTESQKRTDKQKGSAVAAPSPPEFLAEALLDEECVLFAGSGISIPSGLPAWPTLMKDLVGWASDRQLIDPSYSESLRESLECGDVNIAAEGLVQLLKDDGTLPLMAEKLKQVLSGDHLALNPTHKKLKALPFSGVLTTNFDDLLEKNFSARVGGVFTPYEEQELLDAMTQRRFFLLKLHGTVERPETLVMAPALFKEVVINNRAFGQFMQGLFSSRSIVFLGTSLDSIQIFLESFRIRATGRQHCALVPGMGPSEKIKADLLRRRYRIEVILHAGDVPADKVQRNFLDALRAQVDARRLARKRAAGPASLTRVTLENVGMFESLDLELDPRWNVLLGNNGVGKSTVLRAVAAGLSGEDCRPYADRLLRTGTSKGTITLETSSGDRYVTVLERTSGKVDVEAIPTRPIEPEGWLAMGFPPGRHFTWRRSQGGLAETRTRIGAEEVLPLLENVADARPDALKQWILTLDYQAKDLRSRNLPADRPEFLLKRTFEVIGALASGLKIVFKHVEIERGEIIVTTDDGDVPIEALSQGTASLLGWVGVLLHRLSAVCPEDGDPCAQHAIALIDEIEAHMHPAWQQVLVHRLSELFPKVQFIASSHSPLVVSGLPAEQIIRLRRGDGNMVERLPLPADMTMGRADQVLTSRLFGLETTLDTTTRGYLEEYRQLLGAANLSAEQEDRLAELKAEVRFRIPSSAEGPAERRALALVQALLRDQFEDDFPQAHKHLVEYARSLLEEVQLQGGKQL